MSFSKLRELEKRTRTEKTTGPLSPKEAAVILELLRGLPKIFAVLDLYEKALTQVGCEYCDEFGERVDRTMTQARELAGE